MKKIFNLLIVAIILFGFTQAPEIYDACTSKASKSSAKKALKPFGYDASKTTKITFKNKPQLKELEVPLYMGERYRFVFNTEGLPQDVDIAIYNKKYEAKKRKMLFSSKDFPTDQKEFIFEPEKSRKMFVNYIIPPTNDTIKKGCIVMVLGYKIKGKKN